MLNPQTIKSKKRVADHGEVFTAEREVNAMLDLVKHETERIDSRFLEPACGTGNFLVPILERKLAIVKNKYAKSQLEFEIYGVVAMSSVYGVDILEDNVMQCRERLFSIFNEMYTMLYKNKCKALCLDSVRFILSRNILLGDALSLKTVGEKSEPIVFSEWSFVTGSQIKRRDYTFADIIANESAKVGLFADANLADSDRPFFISTPIKEFPLCNFLNISYENTN
jgi:SAM-dependent methyltransferase